MKAFYCSIASLPGLVTVEVAAANLDQAASDVCQCAQEPYAQMEQLKGVVQQAVTSGDYAQMMKLEGDFAGLQDRALSC